MACDSEVDVAKFGSEVGGGRLREEVAVGAGGATLGP